MKKKYFGLIGLVAIFSMATVGCSNNNNNNTSDTINELSSQNVITSLDEKVNIAFEYKNGKISSMFDFNSNDIYAPIYDGNSIISVKTIYGILSLDELKMLAYINGGYYIKQSLNNIEIYYIDDEYKESSYILTLKNNELKINDNMMLLGLNKPSIFYGGRIFR